MVNSGEIPFFMASRTCCVPDSTPNQTETHPAVFIFASRSWVSMSTRVPQFHSIFKQRCRISLQSAYVLGWSTVKASSQNVNFFTPYVLCRNSNSSTTFLGLRIRYFRPCILTVVQNSHQ